MAEITELWEAELLDRGAWNKGGGAKFRPFLINVVAEITELWVENSHKIIGRDITSVREGRVSKTTFNVLVIQG